MNHTAFSRRWLPPFLITEGLLYAAFLYLDLALPGSGWDVPLNTAGLCCAFCGRWARPETGTAG